MKQHEEQVKQMEDELSKLKAENQSLLMEKSQLAENLTALVSYILMYQVLSSTHKSLGNWSTYYAMIVHVLLFVKLRLGQSFTCT